MRNQPYQFYQRLAHHAPYPLVLQGLITLTIIAVPFSALWLLGGQLTTTNVGRFWAMVGVIFVHVALCALVPMRRLHWVPQVALLTAQVILASLAQFLMTTPVIDYVYLMIVLQAIYLFHAWIWIPFAVIVLLWWNGSLIIASTTALEWLQGNLTFAFPATCVLIAAILYANHHRRHERAQLFLQQMQQRYDLLLLALRDLQQIAALEERKRLTQTIASDIQVALARTEQSVALAISQAQSNLVRLQETTLTQTRATASTAIEKLRIAVVNLRHSQEPMPMLSAVVMPSWLTTAPDNDWLAATLTARVLTWVLPSVFIVLALLITLVQSLNVPVFTWGFIALCALLMVEYTLTQRTHHSPWIQVGLVGQIMIVLTMVALTQTTSLLLGLLLVLWQIALRLSMVESIAFFAVIQAAVGALLLRVLPTSPDFLANILLFGVACIIVASMLGMARSQFRRSHHTEQRLVQLATLMHEMEQQAEAARALAVAAERMRLAREFHDDLGSKLTLIGVQLQVAEELIHEDPNAALEQLVSTRDQVRSAWQSLLTAADATLPIDGTLLEQALTDLVAYSRTYTSARIGLHLAGSLEEMPPPVAQAIYRTVQEGLINACKYAAAQAIAVVVACDSSQATVSIADDGGVDQLLPMARSMVGIQGNFGLMGLRERAELLGGTCSAGPLLGGGFEIQMILPLSKETV